VLIARPIASPLWSLTTVGVSYVSASCVAHYSTGRGSLGAEVPLSEWRSLIVRGIPLNAITNRFCQQRSRACECGPGWGLGGYRGYRGHWLGRSLEGCRPAFARTRQPQRPFLNHFCRRCGNLAILAAILRGDVGASLRASSFVSNFAADCRPGSL